MPPCTWIAARAFSTRGLAGEQLRGGAGADRVADLRVVEHGGRGVGRAAGEGGPDVHVGEQVLNGLERADRHAELLALERVAARRLERGVGHAEQHGRAEHRADEAQRRRRRARRRRARPRGSASARPTGVSGSSGASGSKRGQVRLPRRRTRRRRAARAARRSRQRARRRSDRPSRRACSTPPTSRSPRAAPSTHDAASVVHRTGPPTRCAPSCSKTIAAADGAEAEPAARSSGSEQGEDAELGQLAPGAPVDALRPRAARSARARTAPRRTGGRCPGARAALRRGGSPCVAAASLARWKISKCSSRIELELAAQAGRTTS